MAELPWCVFLEWGWTFWIPALIVAIALIIWFGSLVLQSGGSLSLGYEKIKFVTKGRGALGILLTVAIFGAIGYGAYQGYKTLKDAYFVALNTPGRELEQIRNDFQGDTRVELLVRDPAKTFTIAGSYRGACVPDLFESICRQ
ncbi:hypothetical protein QA641_35545 [Bradyrhizobium sp. CB1650]|uniref:hypothetical protein n=1 Tax=Bradyrhizobium sp. CB1650 TaxID=3039153 RepID=UPI002434F2C1|nr:hypothetical protein [Bradyrhizobium sp. CB1650]WGD50851.1 hypothetical protein QA641_35545 [Bradyrhizobium sp. CB1650]